MTGRRLNEKHKHTDVHGRDGDSLHACRLRSNHHRNISGCTRSKHNMPSQGVALYFGSQPHPAVQREIMRVRSKGSVTRLEGEDDVTSCNRAFGKALDNLRSDARKHGANAVIEISTKFKKRGDISMSPDTYVCGKNTGSAVLRLQGRAVVLGAGNSGPHD